MALTQPTASAARTSDFVSTLGINTHIDFVDYGYQNLQTVEAAINYLGVTNIRDSAESPTDAQTWLLVARATGAKFDDYVAETSPAGMATDLSYVAQLASEGILNFIEGGNEEDDSYPASLGNTLPITAQFQQTVYTTGAALGIPVINMSFGAGWTPANDYQGDYGTVGDLSTFANYANAHTYPTVGQSTDWAMQRMNGLAALAASKQPVITTEIGWNESQGFSQADIAKYVVQAALDGMKDGDAKTYFYGLFDDGSGLFGLMNQDGTPKPAGTALHNLTTLLSDDSPTAGTFATGSLNYTLTGTTANDNSLLMEKSDGSYWISLWDENDPVHSVTLTLDGTASELAVFNPLLGTSKVQDVANTNAITLSISDSPLIVEVAGAATSAGQSRPPSASLDPTPQDLSVVTPSAETIAAGATLMVTGVVIDDAWGAAASGDMTLNVWDTGGGTIGMAGQTATATSWISVTDSLAQLNTDVSGLTYTAPAAGGDTITVDVWNQGGVEVQQTIGVTIAAPASGKTPVTPPLPPPPEPVPSPTAVPDPSPAPTVTPTPQDLAVNVPTTQTVAVAASLSISGALISDPWAASASGAMSLNVWDTGPGMIRMAGQSAGASGGITVAGSPSQLNTDLAGLTYTSPTVGTDSITIDAWNQAGVEATQTIGVTITTVASSRALTTSPAAAPTPPPAAPLAPPPQTLPGSITIASSDANPVINDSYVAINASAGYHMLFIGGLHDVATLTGGTETVQAYQGYNVLTTGAANDKISIAGTGNVVDAGGGTNTITDSGGGNTIVMPAAGSGNDQIYGYVLQAGDTLDFTAALKATAWDGLSSALSQFLHVATSGNDAIISISDATNGPSTRVADLHDSGAISIGALLAHAVT
jgi:serralysin